MDFKVVEKQYQGLSLFDVLTKNLSEKEKVMFALKAALYTGSNKEKVIIEALKIYKDTND